MSSQKLGTMRPELGSEALALLAIVRFAGVLWQRKRFIVLALVGTSLLGSVYYFARPRVYLATASLLFKHNGADPLAKAAHPSVLPDSLIPTYEKLFFSELVIDGAVQRIRKLPPGQTGDFSGLPTEDWPAALRSRLSANSLRRTDIIDLSYQSKSPQAGEAIVAAVVDSYLDFMADHYSRSVGTTAKILEQQRHEIEEASPSNQPEGDAVTASDQPAELLLLREEIQKLQGIHELLLNRLASLDRNESEADVGVTIISGPAASRQPVSPQLAAVLSICLAIGLGGGIVSVFVVDLLERANSGLVFHAGEIQGDRVVDDGQRGDESVIPFADPYRSFNSSSDSSAHRRAS